MEAFFVLVITRKQVYFLGSLPVQRYMSGQVLSPALSVSCMDPPLVHIRLAVFSFIVPVPAGSKIIGLEQQLAPAVKNTELVLHHAAAFGLKGFIILIAIRRQDIR